MISSKQQREAEKWGRRNYPMRIKPDSLERRGEGSLLISVPLCDLTEYEQGRISRCDPEDTLKLDVVLGNGVGLLGVAFFGNAIFYMGEQPTLTFNAIFAPSEGLAL